MLICLPQLIKRHICYYPRCGTIWYWENELNGKNLWYPSISKLQQKQSGDWSHVINQLNIQIQRDFSVSV